MNRKTIDQLTEQQTFNNLLLSKSINSTQLTNTLPRKQAAQYYRKYPAIQVKQIELQNILIKRIRTLGEFFQIEKPKTGGVIQQSIQIFDQITDLIDTSSKKYQFLKKSSKKISPSHSLIDSHRPQTKYPHIRPTEFSYHSHSLRLQHIRLDCQIIPSKSILQSFIYVDTVAQFNTMLVALAKQKQISVDLQHSNKSYQGMTCLIQISSRSRDYIIDVFPLWNEIPRLRQIIGNYKIIKVMHGADMDVKWLQRDFDIHIVNLFDTYKASRVLGFPKLSYAYLLNHYCNVDTDKSYQTADWRIRPLNHEMTHYARTDTHYLLEIWDRMRNDLTIKANQLNLEAISVIRNIYQVSHQVTQNEVELFSYPKLQSYQNLKYEMKQQNFKIVDQIYWSINQSAMKYDQSFYDVISKKLLLQSLAVVKDLIYNKVSKVSKTVRIDKIISILKRSKFIGAIELIATIKLQLEEFFLKNGIQQTQEVRQIATNKAISQANQILPSRIQFQQSNFQRIKQLSDFCEYQTQTYQEKIKQFKHERYFHPIIKFISEKYGVQAIDHENQNESVEMVNQNNLKMEQQQIQDDQKIIKFKRMNPNVIYTVEQSNINLSDEAKGKKKRKQQKYEQKVKNKRGSIFDYLQDN